MSSPICCRSCRVKPWQKQFESRMSRPVTQDAGPAADALSGHVTENLENIAAFQLREAQKLGGSHRRLGFVGDIIGRPSYLLALITLIVCWMALNGTAARFGWPALDPPPFLWLQGFLTLVGVLTTTIVLIAQNRYARLDNSRGHLALQLNLLTEQKATKLIHLLEELRRDLPMVANRQDLEVEDLKQHTDTTQVLSAIESVVTGAPPRSPTSSIP